MAPRNLTENHVADEPTDSDSDTESEGEEVATPVVPPKKPKLTTPQQVVVSESVEKPLKEKEEKKANVFSEEDVIVLLKGLAAFWSNARNNKWAEFHLFIKDDLGNQYTRIQVSEKIRRLKKKFDSKSGRGVSDPDPHESAVFELSKALWGEEKKKQTMEDFQSAFPLLYASFDRICKDRCLLIGPEKALELENRWREINAEMHRLELKRLHLMKKHYSKD